MGRTLNNILMGALSAFTLFPTPARARTDFVSLRGRNLEPFLSDWKALGRDYESAVELLPEEAFIGDEEKA